MIEVSVEKQVVNVSALDRDLRAALGNATTGISTREGEVTVHLVDTATQVQQDQARSIVLTHDPAKLTDEQQAEAVQRQTLEQFRQDYAATDLDLSAYAGQAAPIYHLAQKVAWLEQEAKSLRGQ